MPTGWWHENKTIFFQGLLFVRWPFWKAHAAKTVAYYFFNTELILNNLSVFCKSSWCPELWVYLPQITPRLSATGGKNLLFPAQLFLFWAIYLFFGSATTPVPLCPSWYFSCLSLAYLTFTICISPTCPMGSKLLMLMPRGGTTLEERVEVPWTYRCLKSGIIAGWSLKTVSISC